MAMSGGVALRGSASYTPMHAIRQRYIAQDVLVDTGLYVLESVSGIFDLAEAVVRWNRKPSVMLSCSSSEVDQTPPRNPQDPRERLYSADRST